MVTDGTVEGCPYWCNSSPSLLVTRTTGNHHGWFDFTNYNTMLQQALQLPLNLCVFGRWHAERLLFNGSCVACVFVMFFSSWVCQDLTRKENASFFHCGSWINCFQLYFQTLWVHLVTFPHGSLPLAGLCQPRLSFSVSIPSGSSNSATPFIGFKGVEDSNRHKASLSWRNKGGTIFAHKELHSNWPFPQ